MTSYGPIQVYEADQSLGESRKIWSTYVLEILTRENLLYIFLNVNFPVFLKKNYHVLNV
jgi:hypothetical protein